MKTVYSSRDKETNLKMTLFIDEHPRTGVVYTPKLGIGQICITEGCVSNLWSIDVWWKNGEVTDFYFAQNNCIPKQAAALLKEFGVTTPEKFLEK